MELISNEIFKLAKELEESKVRAVKLVEGLVFELIGKGYFGYYDDMIYRVIPVVEEFEGVLRTTYKKTNTKYTLEEFSEYSNNK